MFDVSRVLCAVEPAGGAGARAGAGEQPAEHGGGGGREQRRQQRLPAARAAARVARPALGKRLQVGRRAVADPTGTDTSTGAQTIMAECVCARSRC